MKRLLAIAAIFALVATACTAGGEDPGPAPEPPGTTGEQEPVTIEMWGAWTGRELRQFNQIFDGFTEEYPWITVESVGGVGDNKILAAINSGAPPDAVLSFGLDSVSQFCASGAWQDMTPFIERDSFDLSQFPEAVFQYTSYEGKQCAFPFLTDAYGLYYNTNLFENAGLTEPPRTMSELVETAKQLTEFNPDGSIKVAGFVPWFGYYQFTPSPLSVMWGADWYTEDLSAAAVGNDSDWASLFEWQKELVDFYGEDNLARFVAGAGDEWSSPHDFQNGRVAMTIDGEWRTAFIADTAPDLPYATAPFPVPDDREDLYGMGQIGGTIIGIPRGAPHLEEAWLLVSWMATDTDTLVYMANNVRNVPTTFAALESPELDVTPQFQTFLDIFAHPESHYKQTTPIGAADQEIVTSFAEDWQAGDAASLGSGLQEAAQQINDQLAQAGV